MTFIDTGILVGALLKAHPRHPSCSDGLAQTDHAFTNAHVVAEVFSTLTGLYKVPNGAATELVLALDDCLLVEPLTWGDYKTAIKESRARGVMGGGIYDALHATFARRKKASRIVTLNPSHFHHVAPDIEILTP